MRKAFTAIDDSDFLFVVITSNNKSEGMLLEIGYCLAKKKPIIVAIDETVSGTYTPELADKVISFSNLVDLATKIRKLNLTHLIK